PPSLSSHRHHLLHSGPTLHTSVSSRGANLPPSRGVAMNIWSQWLPKIAEGRGAQRQALIWKGVLHHDNQSVTVKVRNVSTTGAIIQSPTPVAVGSESVLELSDSVTIAATVQWTRSKER